MHFDKIAHFVLGLSFLCVLLTLVAVSAQAGDHEVLPTSAAEIVVDDPARQLILRQLDAISARDADLAFALMTASFHDKFNDSKDFLSHLRFHQRAIYNHENVRFLEREDTGAGILQKVEMLDRYGDPVTVLYRLKQDGDHWLIDSFAVLETDAQPI